MARNRALIPVVVVLGVILLVVAALYFAETAKSLPSFFPGHVSSTSSEATHHHTKHGIAALAVALGCFVFAWFQTGPKNRTAASA
jgi:flagellar basal body-associated protein FliL